MDFPVKTIWEVYGTRADRLDDDTWLRECGERGWVALTSDKLRQARHRTTMKAAGTRVFRLSRSLASADDQTDALKVNQHRIAQRARRAGPFIDVIGPRRVERRWP
jgi:hypothetical protein